MLLDPRYISSGILDWGAMNSETAADLRKLTAIPRDATWSASGSLPRRDFSYAPGATTARLGRKVRGHIPADSLASKWGPRRRSANLS
jgi:hypothetical protein